MSVEIKIRNLITEINEATGQNDSSLSNAIATLKKGYLGDAVLQSKRVNVTQNGAKVITPDEGYNALSQVIVTTSVTEEEIDPDAFHAYYVEYDPAVADYKKVWICRLSGGEVINVKEGTDVDESNVGTSDYNPALIFKEWSCPLPIINNQVTIPDVICADVYIGAIYDTVDGQTYYVGDDGQVYNDNSLDPLAIICGIYYGVEVTDATPINKYRFLNRVVFSSFTQSISSQYAYESTISHIVFPTRLTSVPREAFYGCKDLKAVVFGNNVQSIGESAFYLSSSHSFFLPRAAQTISKSSFIQSVITGFHHESDGSIYGDSFMSASTVKYLRLADDASYASYLYCLNVKEIYSNQVTNGILKDDNTILCIAGRIETAKVSNKLPYQLRWDNIIKLVIEPDAKPFDTSAASKAIFSYRSPLEVEFSGETTLERAFYYSSNKNPGPNVRRITGENIIEILNASFDGCYELTSVDFPNATNIGQSAFSNCSKLTSVDFPNAINIGQNAFYGALPEGTSIYLPAVRTIQSYAFRWSSSGNNAKTLYAHLGEYVESIESYAFGYSSNYAYLQRNLYLKIEAVTPPTLGGKLTGGDGYVKEIYVPDESVDAYKAATNWSAYSSVIKPLSEFTGDW